MMEDMGTVLLWQLLHWSSCRWLCVSEAPLSRTTLRCQHRFGSEIRTDQGHTDPTETLPNETPHMDYRCRISTPPETGLEDTIYHLKEKNDFSMHTVDRHLHDITKFYLKEHSKHHDAKIKEADHAENWPCDTVLNWRRHSAHFQSYNLELKWT